MMPVCERSAERAGVFPLIWRKPGVCHVSGEPCTLLRLQIPCAPLRRCHSMESFRVKAARQFTVPLLELRVRARRSETRAFVCQPRSKRIITHQSDEPVPWDAENLQELQGKLESRVCCSHQGSRRTQGAIEQSACLGLSIGGGLSQITARFCHSSWKLDALSRKKVAVLAPEGGSIDLDLLAVGGGLAGLPAAALAAQTGPPVVVFKRAGDVAGQAVSLLYQGTSFNLGPDALYFLGHEFKLLRALGVAFSERIPNPGQSCVLTNNGQTTLPPELASLLHSPRL
jgi:hypothetical protein